MVRLFVSFCGALLHFVIFLSFSDPCLAGIFTWKALLLGWQRSSAHFGEELVPTPYPAMHSCLLIALKVPLAHKLDQFPYIDLNHKMCGFNHP